MASEMNTDLNDVSNGEEDHSVPARQSLTFVDDGTIPPTLSTILREISQDDASILTDPLSIIPLLLPWKHPIARNILSQVAKCGPAKEVIIAVQESIERLERSYDDGEDEDTDGDGISSAHEQLLILVELYASCIPRLKLRRKPAYETIRPLFTQLEQLLRIVGTHVSNGEGRNTITTISGLVRRTVEWAKSNAEEKDLSACKKCLESTLDCTLESFGNCIQSSVAQRSFENFFPRLTVRSAVKLGWEEGKQAVLEIINAYSVLGPGIPSPPSIASTIVFAHSKLEIAKSMDLLHLMPGIISSIESGCALDEAMAILLHGLEPLIPSPRPQLPEEIIHPLFAILPTLSSSHPDPSVRHQAFRALSLLLSSCMPPLHIQFLKDLATDPQFPQMRVAAVRLIKEVVLDALSSQPTQSVFTSMTFLTILGPVIFRTSPQDLFTGQELSLDSFIESSEPARLVECLGLFYTLLRRDVCNKTGIRDNDMLIHIEMTFLSPMRNRLKSWRENQGNAPTPFVIVSLQMILQRVDEAKSEIIYSQRDT